MGLPKWRLCLLIKAFEFYDQQLSTGASSCVGLVSIDFDSRVFVQSRRSLST